MTEANTPSPDEDRELIERLREPDSHDPICPFNLHCYCDDSAPHDNISDDDKIKAADRIESLLSDRAKLEEPTPTMIEAGIMALDDCVDSDWDSGHDGESHNTYTTIRSDAAVVVFRAMIAALNRSTDRG